MNTETILVLAVGVVGALYAYITFRKEEAIKHWEDDVYDPGWSIKSSWMDVIFSGTIQGYPVRFLNCIKQARGGPRNFMSYCFLEFPVSCDITIKPEAAVQNMFRESDVWKVQNIANLYSMEVIGHPSIWNTLIRNRPLQFINMRGVCLCKNISLTNWQPEVFKEEFKLMMSLAQQSGSLSSPKI